MSNTELISASSYNTDKMIFSDPIENSIPDSKPAICYRRINISTLNDDGSVGELIIPTEQIYSYGVSENTNQETGKVNGYTLPLVLFNKNGPTTEEKAFVECFNSIVDKCKDYLLENKETLDLYELEAGDLKKMSGSIYLKKEKGKVVEGASPTLYAKLIVKKDRKDNTNKIISAFFDEETGEPIDPIELMGKAGYARAAIKFESIFIGNKISLQVKLYECEYKIVQTGMRRLLLQRPKADTKVAIQSESKKSSTMPLNDDDDDNGSLVGDDDDELTLPVEEVKEPPKKTVVRKVVKKVVTK